MTINVSSTELIKDEINLATILWHLFSMIDLISYSCILLSLVIYSCMFCAAV